MILSVGDRVRLKSRRRKHLFGCVTIVDRGEDDQFADDPIYTVRWDHGCEDQRYGEALVELTPLEQLAAEAE